MTSVLFAMEYLVVVSQSLVVATMSNRGPLSSSDVLVVWFIQLVRAYVSHSTLMIQLKPVQFMVFVEYGV